MKVFSVLPLMIALLLAASSCNRTNSEHGMADQSTSPVESGRPTSSSLTGPVSWQPLTQRVSSNGALFERLKATHTGINFQVPIDASHPLKRLYAGSFFCGGIAIGDIDNDDRPDLYLISGPGKNALYRQTKPLEFEDVTATAGVDGGEAWGTGCAMVDIDNDGDLDLYVCNYDSPNLLYLNQGNGRFFEAASQFGLDIVDCCLLPAFCDYDRDGDLDCYLLTNRFYREGGFPRDMKITLRNGQPQIPPEYSKYYRVRRTGRTTGEFERIGRPDRLLRNDGHGSFSDVSDVSGMSREPGYGLSATWWDFDLDGDPDLYVGNDYHAPDHLYRNNGDGTFTDVIEQQIPHTTWFSMGADFGDINNDGLFDFLTVDMSATTHFGQKTTMGDMGQLFRLLEKAEPPQYMRNALYLNTGTGRFMEVAYLCGLASTDWSWTPKLADLDNDGWLDAFITNGMTRNMIDSDHSFTLADEIGRTKWDLYESLPSLPQQNLAYRNLGDLEFQDTSQSWGLDHVGLSFASATGDLDRDGDLDLVVANLDEPVSIYRNRSEQGHRLLVQLRGNQSNRWGFGAVVRIETASGQQIRQMVPSTGYLSSNEPIIHFGLGPEDTARRLIVNWPSGNRQVIEDVPADRFYTIIETPSTTAESISDLTEPLFLRSEAFTTARHVEREFDDFARQPLLPNKLSQLGPGVAVSDVDGDGDDDVYLSGAAGLSGQLFVNQKRESFLPKPTTAFANDAECEDMASLFFDVDSDGDHDLYVVSGGNEHDTDAPWLQDRLYLNDGLGNFTPAADGLIPNARDSGGPVAACDFDRDGDLDLFVGGRLVPGRYPLTPTSRLLRNDNGRLVDATLQVAADLRSTGLVTSAIWSDCNNDGWLDLLVAHEWGPIKLFQNAEGRLVDRTEAVGLDRWLGWWNAIAGRDLDGDQDLDYLVTNFGLNTKYHASREAPALLFCGDFEGTGRLRLVEAEYEAQQLYPVRGRSCSTAAMPFLGNKFDSYRSFALASLEEIYSHARLEGSQKLVANTLHSGAFINDGQGRMEFVPLPNLAQASPGFGIVLTEINGDGNPDAYVVQNFFSPQIETGRMDGGLSLLLHGNGDGTFTPIWPAESGLVVSGDAKGLAIVDLNQDARPDFLIGTNSGELIAYAQQQRKQHRLLTVRLRGSPGNPSAIGSRVTINVGGRSQTAEVYAGSGYLSQSTATLTFGWGSESTAAKLEVRWPDGTTSSHTVPNGQQQITIDSPQASDPKLPARSQ